MFRRLKRFCIFIIVLLIFLAIASKGLSIATPNITGQRQQLESIMESLEADFILKGTLSEEQ